MFAYTVRRLIAAIPVLLASSFISFWLASVSADPIRAKFAGRNPPPPRATIDFERHRMRMDEGFFKQYWDWLWSVLRHGDFGPSVISSNRVISDDLAGAAAVTLRLVIAAMIIALILAVITGVVSAYRQYSKLDYTLTFIGFLFLAMPTFWIAGLLKEKAITVNDAIEGAWGPGHRPLGTVGARSSVPPHGFFPVLGDYAGHLLLPTISLALITYAAWSRFQRGSMLEVLNSDYIRLARAKGLAPRRVMIRHALRTALIPMTTVSALTIAGIIGGAVITETVFQWRGMGSFLLEAIDTGDRYAMIAWMLLAGVFVIVGNIVADLLYAVLDPRIRYA
jgi:peptide/nickel transport system permease protein